MFNKSAGMNREFETHRRRGMSCVTMVKQEWKQIDNTPDTAQEI
jgi:hypothetical protein